MISTEQVLGILRQVANKEIAIEASEMTDCGHVVITARDRSFWISFFIDCDELDYVDECIVADNWGRFDNWDDPLDWLYVDECIRSDPEYHSLLSAITEAGYNKEVCDLVWDEWCNFRMR